MRMDAPNLGGHDVDKGQYPHIHHLDATVIHIAKLADRFLIKKVLHWSDLIASNKFTVEKKLQFADAYRFPNLMHTSLQTFQTLQQLKVFQNFPAYNKFSNDTKIIL